MKKSLLRWFSPLNSCKFTRAETSHVVICQDTCPLRTLYDSKGQRTFYGVTSRCKSVQIRPARELGKHQERWLCINESRLLEAASIHLPLYMLTFACGREMLRFLSRYLRSNSFLKDLLPSTTYPAFFRQALQCCPPSGARRR
jgi:hypothetical protein